MSTCSSSSEPEVAGTASLQSGQAHSERDSGPVKIASTASRTVSAETHAALTGVFMQLFNHGITAAALFYFVGLLEQRRGLRRINDFGGLMQCAPLLCGWMSVAMFSSLGLPGLNGFIGEFLIFKGSFGLASTFTAIALLGLLFTAITFMRAMQTLFSGPVSETCAAFPDLQLREKFVIVPISLLMFAIGVAPQHVVAAPGAQVTGDSATPAHGTIGHVSGDDAAEAHGGAE